MSNQDNLKEKISEYLERQKIMKQLLVIVNEVKGKMDFMPRAEEADKIDLAIIFLKGCLDDMGVMKKIVKTDPERIEKAGYHELQSLLYI